MSLGYTQHGQVLPLYFVLLIGLLCLDCVQMDASISHSSKSYYACVGESTHAYQSPSKDLVAINSRLNG